MESVYEGREAESGMGNIIPAWPQKGRKVEGWFLLPQSRKDNPGYRDRRLSKRKRWKRLIKKPLQPHQRGVECVRQPSPKRQNQWDGHIHTLFFFLKELAHIKVLKSIMQAARLEVRVRVDFAILSPNSAGLQVGNSGWVLENSFYFGKPQSLFLRLSTDEMRPTYIVEANLLYWKSHLNVNFI